MTRRTIHHPFSRFGTLGRDDLVLHQMCPPYSFPLVSFRIILSSSSSSAATSALGHLLPLWQFEVAKVHFWISNSTLRVLHQPRLHTQIRTESMEVARSGSYNHSARSSWALQLTICRFTCKEEMAKDVSFSSLVVCNAQGYCKFAAGGKHGRVNWRSYVRYLTFKQATWMNPTTSCHKWNCMCH